jgi:hypothetical protein
MKTNLLLRLYKILSFTIIILGIIHDVATFTPLVRGGLATLSRADFHAVIFMSLGTGTSFILAGLLLFTVYNIKTAFDRLVLPVNIFLSFMGIMAVVMMPSNPFAWISFIVMILLFTVSLVIWKKE